MTLTVFTVSKFKVWPFFFLLSSRYLLAFCHLLFLIASLRLFAANVISELTLQLRTLPCVAREFIFKSSKDLLEKLLACLKNRVYLSAWEGGGVRSGEGEAAGAGLRARSRSPLWEVTC